MSIQTIRVVFVGTFPQASSRFIDLGIIDLAEVYTMGVKELIPYSAGRLIKSVFFTFDGFVDEPNNEINFVSGNVGDPAGSVVWARIGRQFQNELPRDTMGIWSGFKALQLDGNSGNLNQSIDSTPLYVGIHPSFSYLPISGWQANTLYSFGEFILDSNGQVQSVDTPGLSGGTEPAWAAFPGQTTDNEITWNTAGPPAVGKIHAFAEVIDSNSILPVPTTIDWVTQPTNTVAGQTMAAFTIRVLDQNGDSCVFPDAFTGLYLQIVGGSPPSGTYNQVFNGNANPTTGIFTFNDFVFNTIANGVKLRAYFQGVGVSPVDSNSFNIT